MKTTPVSPENLQRLPPAIWMSAPQADAAFVYYGSPVEMVRQMAAEMGSDVSVPTAVATLLTALYRNRGVLIAIPEDAPEEFVAAMFVHALLDTGISKPVSAEG